jgi:hypothetical protein
MMGFLQKFMDLSGLQIEQASFDQAGDFLTSLGWGPGRHLIAPPADRLQELDGDASKYKDSLFSTFQVLPFLPPLLLWERKVTANVPSTWPQVGFWLLDTVGYHFPLLGKLRHGRVLRPIATLLRDNLDVSQCNLAPGTKLLCGIIYATIANNSVLVADLQRCTLRLAPHFHPDTMENVKQFAREKIDFNATSITLSATLLGRIGADLSLADRRALLMAKAASTSPATLTPVVVGGMEELFSPAAMVEQMTWMAVMQMLSRLYLFHLDPEINPDLSSRNPDSPFWGPRRPSEAAVSPDETANASEQSKAPALDERKDAEFASSTPAVSEPGGRISLKGAEPVFRSDSDEPMSLDSTGSVYGTRRRYIRESSSGVERLLVQKQHVEEDEAVVSQSFETGSLVALAERQRTVREGRIRSLPSTVGRLDESALDTRRGK